MNRATATLEIVEPSSPPELSSRKEFRSVVTTAYFRQAPPVSQVSLKIQFLKRGLDWGLSGFFLVLTFPLFLMIMLLIKLTSKGPILYKQIRIGEDRRNGPRTYFFLTLGKGHDPRQEDWGGRPFEILKFRTMIHEAEKGTGPMWSIKNDPRITAVGKFLRKTHLDELPQLLNILRGEMSLVGPRPERPFFVQKLKGAIPQYTKRTAVKPGLTGLAQIRHKYDESVSDVKKKIRYDLFYIKNCCLLFDLKILFQTFGILIVKSSKR